MSVTGLEFVWKATQDPNQECRFSTTDSVRLASSMTRTIVTEINYSVRLNINGEVSKMKLGQRNEPREIPAEYF